MQFFANIIASNQAIQDSTADPAGAHPDSGFHAPDAEIILKFLEENDYDLEVSTGQRKLTPKANVGKKFEENGQCFIGSLNREAFESEIIKLLAEIPAARVRKIIVFLGYFLKKLKISKFYKFLVTFLGFFKIFRNFLVFSYIFFCLFLECSRTFKKILGK